jgi:hypothetical protein
MLAELVELHPQGGFDAEVGHPCGCQPIRSGSSGHGITPITPRPGAVRSWPLPVGSRR